MAQAVKLSLNGQNIYNACFTLLVKYSKLSNLNMKYNNNKSRDHTDPSRPTDKPSLDMKGTNAPALQGEMRGNPLAAMGLANLARHLGSAGCVLLVSNISKTET